ncbi:hypothetical protein [Glycomyces niveus]|uniref:Uncharacterized protein n=1 Tax=Glycomyces niveus TaxID=2820287 RepID=A0ABS3U6W1_9ACTN|nr:hypothetical protein [Glycomyces sp. NEAU-S30]MBO3734502.1 hypothetical protein [Glycomyces sp. NEAU-S30]
MRVLLQQAFYRHDHLGPGAPLREITGQGDGDGYYDWAGRRLFLIDGEPDPMCPGAYRYQHNPDCCDLEAPDSDPRSPRYEPMHLRHKVGDTWIIDANRPYDPFDPGPYGSRGWYKDERTGRHRRDETPDPLPADDWVPPADAWFPGTADWPEPEPTPTRTGDGRRGDRDRPGDSFGRGGSDRPPPWGSRGRPVPSEPDEPDEPEASQRPWGERNGRPSPSADTKAKPARRPWDRSDDGDGPGDAGWISGYGRGQSNQREDNDPGGHGVDGRNGTDTTGEYRFSKLREDAFDRFIANSAGLQAAHFAPQKPYLRERAAWVLHWLAWVLTCGLIAMPAPLNQHQHHPEPHAAHPIPTQPGPRTHESKPEAVRAEEVQPANDFHNAATPAAGPSGPQPVEASDPPRPGAAIAAAIGGARAARKVIAARESRTEHDLARAVRNSANRTDGANHGRPAPGHWRTRPRQNRPRPSPRPQPAAYMTAWEQAFDNFDSRGTLIFGGAA